MTKKPTYRKEKARRQRPITPEYLNRAALHYLERYASSSENLRQVLLRKVRRAARDQEVDETASREWIDELVTRFLQAGLLNDTEYTRMKVGALHRRGNSGRAIRQKLTQKGVDTDLVDAALAELAEEESIADTDLAAAVTYARRRRIGPFRREKREENRDRDLAALGRQGYSYDIAKKVLDGEFEEF